ncbi:MAG: YlbF family regulator [Bacilli bacterium]|nr:YlbF family regulator [Bacilli bacterium]
MEKKLSKAVSEVVSSITESPEFKECIRLKEKMEESSEIKELVDAIKKLQKKYIRTQDDEVKKELDEKQERLNSIPLYDSYQKKLAEVNQKIEIIKDELNDYFYNVVNEKK